MSKEIKNVNRDSIYVGEVVLVKGGGIGQYDANYVPTTPFDKAKANELYVYQWRAYRSMLFVLNEQKLATDLLYSSPNYPVLNVSDNAVCLNSDIVIKDAYNLSLLLQYFNYREELTLDDVKSIRKIFFTGRFGMDNSTLFGIEEFIPEQFIAYKNGVKINDPNERYELYKQSLRLGSERQFGSIPTNVLPRELMNVLDGAGRNSYIGVSGDVFKPNAEEGPIKKLKRF